MMMTIIELIMNRRRRRRRLGFTHRKQEEDVISRSKKIRMESWGKIKRWYLILWKSELNDAGGSIRDDILLIKFIYKSIFPCQTFGKTCNKVDRVVAKIPSQNQPWDTLLAYSIDSNWSLQVHWLDKHRQEEKIKTALQQDFDDFGIGETWLNFSCSLQVVCSWRASTYAAPTGQEIPWRQRTIYERF